MRCAIKRNSQRAALCLWRYQAGRKSWLCSVQVKFSPRPPPLVGGQATTAVSPNLRSFQTALQTLSTDTLPKLTRLAPSPRAGDEKLLEGFSARQRVAGHPLRCRLIAKLGSRCSLLKLAPSPPSLVDAQWRRHRQSSVLSKHKLQKKLARVTLNPRASCAKTLSEPTPPTPRSRVTASRLAARAPPALGLHMPTHKRSPCTRVMHTRTLPRVASCVVLNLRSAYAHASQRNWSCFASSSSRE